MVDKYVKPRKCPVCGLHRGNNGVDHSACSKHMKKHGDAKRSKASKTFGEKYINELIKFINDQESRDDYYD